MIDSFNLHQIEYISEVRENGFVAWQHWDLENESFNFHIINLKDGSILKRALGGI